MAHLHRLIVLVLLLVAGAAHASFTAPTTTTWSRAPYNGGLGGASQVWGSAVGSDVTAVKAACSSAQVAWAANGGAVLSFNPSSPGLNSGLSSCSVYTSKGEFTMSKDTVTACPANSTGTTSCTCSSGYTQSGSMCVDNDTAACSSLTGQTAPSSKFDAGPSTAGPTRSSYSFCDAYNATGGGKCVATTVRDSCAESAGRWVCNGPATYTGAKASTCTGSGGSGTDPAPNQNTVDPGTGPTNQNPCPDGFAGSVNGQTVCIKAEPDKGIESGKTVEQTNADGTKSSTSSQTTCKAGICTTVNTTTNYNSSGTVTSTTTDTKKQPIGDLCKADGGNKACSTVGLGEGDGGGSFTGDCVAGFKAVGDDPVINAMALETYRQNCKVNPDTDSQALAKAEAVKTGNQTGDNPNNSSVSIGSGNFDTSDALGVGSTCPADRVIPLAGGRSFALPWSQLCGSLNALGAVLVAVSLLLAARIVTRG